MSLFGKSKQERQKEEMVKMATELMGEIGKVIDQHNPKGLIPVGPGQAASIGQIPVRCAQCGHLFDRVTGTSRKVKMIRQDGATRIAEIFFCSMHIPKWDTAEAKQVEGSDQMGELQNFKKYFPVDIKGRIVKASKRK